MQKFKSSIATYLPFPLFQALIAILAFGLLIPTLGFYWDDWPMIFLAEQGSTELLRDFYSYIRPLSFWTYLVTLPVLGVTPLHWHVFLLVLRLLTAVQLWLTLRLLWPRAERIAAMAGVLFLVYPSFSQGPIAVAYSQHFIVYNLFLFSLYAMLRSLQAQKTRWVWLSLAVFASLAHLLTMEYFAGLELVRPLVLLVWFHKQGSSFKNSAIKTGRHWLPYLAVLVVFLLWRINLVMPNDPNRLVWIGLPAFTQATLQNFTAVVVDAWANTLTARLIDFSDRAVLFSLVLAGITAIICFVYLHSSSDKQDAPESAAGQSVLLGISAILFGMLPIQFTGRTVLGGLFVDRFSLPAMLGAALLFAGLLHLLLSKSLHRNVLFAILVGLAVGAHLRSTNEYRWDWEEQRRMYWQFYWRAPNLEAGTALVGPEVMTAYTSGYAAAAAINTLYQASISEDGEVDYWVLDYYDNLMTHEEDLENELDLNFSISNLYFSANSEKLIFYDNTNDGQCVWFLNESDQYNSLVDPGTRTLAALSQLNLASASGAETPNPDIFGEEPEQTWCYYFQKMDLARQQEDWDTVLSLWETTKTYGYSSTTQFAMFPIVEALLRTGQEQEAAVLTADILLKQPAAREKLCYAWHTWLPEATIPQALASKGC